MFQKLIKSKMGKAWVITSSIVIVLALVISILASTVFFNLVCTFLGRKKPVYAAGIASMYPALDTYDKQEALANANAKTVEICEEGFVLLKNNNTLPLSSGAKVSVFGKNSVNLSYGGSGSSGFTGVKYVTLKDSLTSAGFAVNDTLWSFYEDNSKSGKGRSENSSDLDSGDNTAISTGETPQASYTSAVKSSYANYNDAAIVVITRIGGEGFDLPRYQGNTEGAVSKESHYLELDTNERDLLTAVTNEFDKVVVLFNIPSAFEATFLVDTSYLPCADKIDAALWMGFTGGEGVKALGKVLNGDVNPSGRTVDTWASDFLAIPSVVNFGTGMLNTDSDKYTGSDKYYFVDYEEGEYVGYRYYETRYATEADGDEWYADNVVYPFGYGLSYTNFTWEIDDKSQIDGVTIDGETEYSVKVKVTNAGNVAGKDVVELYAHAPYVDGEIEKAEKVLVGFAKTDLLAPGASDVVTLTFDPYYLASYDYRDANGNDFAGYELDGGNYELYVAKNAHDESFTIPFKVAPDGIIYDVDPVTGNEVLNRFTDSDYGYFDSDYQLSTILSRSDWEGTWPDKPDATEKAGTRDLFIELGDAFHNNPNDLDGDMPEFGKEVTIKLRDLLPAETPETTFEALVDYDDERWETILSQCSASDLLDLCNYGAYQTEAIENIGLPATTHGDGPSGFTCFLNKEQIKDTCHYCSEPVMSSTWNVDLIKELGHAIGEEGIWGNEETNQPYSSIYAPGVNIHRNPFGGRCAEYFSEDPLLSGKMGAAEIQGCQERGVICMVKHFALNEQETHRARYGDCSWATEQSIREIYLKSFEIAVKEGKSRGLMTSFNRIGTKWTGGDYRLCTEILRDEWGFRGCVICDFNTHPEYMFSDQMEYAGGDLNLQTIGSEWNADSADVADMLILRQAAKNILYAFVNSNAMNGEVIGYDMPVWQIVMIIVDCVLAVGIIVWGAIVILQTKKA